MSVRDDIRLAARFRGLLRECQKEYLLEFSDRRAGLLRTLMALEPDVQRHGPGSVEAGLLNYWTGRLLAFGPAEDAGPRLRAALASDKIESFLTKEERVNGALALAHCCRVFEGAKHGKSVLDQLLIDVDFDLSVATCAAFDLHKWGLYAEALELNLEILSRASLPGVSQRQEFVTVIRNIAENHYMLGQLEAAVNRLEEVLELADRTGNPALAVEMRFKLGVLAFEAQEKSQALRHMEEGLRIASLSGQEALIGEAERNLAELLRKL